MKKAKITVIGAGYVGTTTMHWLATKGLGDIVLLNRTASKAVGKALDLQTASACSGLDYTVKGTGNYKDTADSDIVIITAGAQRKEGMSRDDLLDMNVKIVKDITKNVVKHSPKAVLLVISNPLDATVYAAWKMSKFPAKRVIGMAGILDTSRMETFIAEAARVSIQNVKALVMGSHGDLMIPLVRYSSISGLPLTDFIDKKKIAEIVERTRKGGHEIIELMHGSAHYSPGAAVVKMVKAILYDEKLIVPCSCYLSGQYGVKGYFMGVPAMLGKDGVEKIIEVQLNSSEKKAWKKSADAVKKLIKNL